VSKATKPAKPSVTRHLAVKEVVVKGSPSTPARITASRGGSPASPVEKAAREGVGIHLNGDVVEADDADALRIARVVAEHRKGLMDRLAK
jgi:hypothetical protein